MQVLASQLPFLANRDDEVAVPLLFRPVNCVKTGRLVASLSGSSNCLFTIQWQIVSCFLSIILATKFAIKCLSCCITVYELYKKVSVIFSNVSMNYVQTSSREFCCFRLSRALHSLYKSIQGRCPDGHCGQAIFGRDTSETFAFHVGKPVGHDASQSSVLRVVYHQETCVDTMSLVWCGVVWYGVM